MTQPEAVAPDQRRKILVAYYWVISLMGGSFGLVGAWNHWPGTMIYGAVLSVVFSAAVSILNKGES